jgi:hypothetical protein
MFHTPFKRYNDMAKTSFNLVLFSFNPPSNPLQTPFNLGAHTPPITPRRLTRRFGAALTP